MLSVSTFLETQVDTRLVEINPKSDVGFLVSGLAPGTYKLAAIGAGRVTRSSIQEVTLFDGQESGPHMITVTRGDPVTISLSVLGRPLNVGGILTGGPGRKTYHNLTEQQPPLHFDAVPDGDYVFKPFLDYRWKLPENTFPRTIMASGIDILKAVWDLHGPREKLTMQTAADRSIAITLDQELGTYFEWAASNLAAIAVSADPSYDIMRSERLFNEEGRTATEKRCAAVRLALSKLRVHLANGYAKADRSTMSKELLDAIDTADLKALLRLMTLDP
jgi:hypothetical protein